MKRNNQTTEAYFGVECKFQKAKKTSEIND